ncbi:hypothetical protein [Haloechinothrix aidingensis]|nr:hypothetical protein [Haloechinothrix aidingensis]
MPDPDPNDVIDPDTDEPDAVEITDPDHPDYVEPYDGATPVKEN